MLNFLLLFPNRKRIHFRRPSTIKAKGILIFSSLQPRPLKPWHLKNPAIYIHLPPWQRYSQQVNYSKRLSPALAEAQQPFS
jgi:hypothetical protein